VPNVIGIIPARYQSKRFPGKPLALLGGTPLIAIVYNAVLESRLIDDVYVATDDPRIESAVKQHGGKVIITASDHPTGSDRVAEAARRVPEAGVIVNIQGDEPFISGEIVDKVISELYDGDAVMSTACAPITDPRAADDPNIVKVVLDNCGNALYFSRSRIPYTRKEGESAARLYRHIGIYGFKKDFLLDYSNLKRTPLEMAEGLEQLRALEHGYKIKTAIVEWDFPGIDTREDLIRAEAFLGERERRNG